MERFMFILKVIGVLIGVTALIVGWGVVIANGYGISEAPYIILSSINVIAILSLTYFTYSYMKSTEDMAKEMKASRDMEFEMNYKPKVTLDFEVKSNGLVYVVVNNEGKGAARNIRFCSNPPLTNSAGLGMDRWPALKNGIDYLPPGKKLTFFFDQTNKIEGSRTAAEVFEVTIQYEWDIQGKPNIVDKYPLELSPYSRTDLRSYRDVSTLIDEIEGIGKALAKKATTWEAPRQH